MADPRSTRPCKTNWCPNPAAPEDEWCIDCALEGKVPWSIQRNIPRDETVRSEAYEVKCLACSRSYALTLTPTQLKQIKVIRPCSACGGRMLLDPDISTIGPGIGAKALYG